MKTEKTFAKSDVYEIIDKAIKKEMANKNHYIELNGYAHKDVLQAFDNRIAALSGLYHEFN